ncbi:putative AMP dependent ligase/synthetase [Xylariales sp. PMI_506]|nr:putative AMP dependent ligase/synthetase [Xylariales sp. PMI_506]
MIFYPPSWLPALQQDLSTTGTIGDFILRGPLAESEETTIDTTVLISAQTNETKTPRQIAEDVEALATALAHDLQWSVEEQGQDGKVIAILSENTLNYLTCCWAIHRLGATCLLLHGSTSPVENAKHLKDSNCKTIIVSPALLMSGRAAAAAAGMAESEIRWYSTQPLGVTGADSNGTNGNKTNDRPEEHNIKSLATLLASSSNLSSLPELGWVTEGNQPRIAYLCPTSGTSGVQKLAKLTHRSIIANILQVVALESTMRKRDVDVVLGIMPLSHVQGIVASHGSIYLRDRYILHLKFDMKESMLSIQAHRVHRLYLVPSVLAAIIGNPYLFKIFDLSTIDSIYVGAGSISLELYQKTKAVQPNWNLVTGYGLTESPAAVAMSSSYEFVPGSVGILLPEYRARLCREDGSEVEDFDEPGQLLVSSPNQAVGYLGDEETSAKTFRDGWLYTGDIAVFRKSPKGDSHLYIIDRLRDMIKVKGLQVSPLIIEDCLRQHKGIADVAVIGVPDDLDGERAKAIVVLSNPKAGPEEIASLFEEWDEHVQNNLTEPHWIHGRYELIETLPRNPSGKVSKGMLRGKTV